ncbi:hypothetical protein, partial [Massilia genomosp. 1]|uniref:hypothetical protein n=1 Tax=Massilia genomosp. 1 TaxID=2609280 RepID=UPI001C9E253A
LFRGGKLGKIWKGAQFCHDQHHGPISRNEQLWHVLAQAKQLQLSLDEIESVSGGTIGESAKAVAIAGAIGAGAFGAGWGTMAVGAAIAVSPLGVMALAGCAGYAGWRLLSAK